MDRIKASRRHPAMDLLTLLKRVEERGAIETTHRIQQNCGQVFRYAVANTRPTRIHASTASARVLRACGLDLAVWRLVTSLPSSRALMRHSGS